jgi:hypothetical protein
MTDRELGRRILKNNLDRNHPELGKAEKERALDVAEAAFHGNTSNGEATAIGVRAVLNEREHGRRG